MKRKGIQLAMIAGSLAAFVTALIVTRCSSGGRTEIYCFEHTICFRAVLLGGGQWVQG